MCSDLKSVIARPAEPSSGCIHTLSTPFSRIAYAMDFPSGVNCKVWPEMWLASRIRGGLDDPGSNNAILSVSSPSLTAAAFFTTAVANVLPSGETLTSFAAE